MTISTQHSADVKNPYGKSYQWPNSLYQELAQIGDCSFLTHVVGYIVAATRKQKHNDEFKGLEIDNRGNASKPPKTTTKSLRRNFTPSEIKHLILINMPLLQQHFSDIDVDGSTCACACACACACTCTPQLSLALQRLDELEKKPIDATNPRAGFRPYTFEELEDRLCQHKGISYGVVRDRHHKRITLVFRGRTSPPMENNNNNQRFGAAFKAVPLPNVLKGKLRLDNDDDDVTSSIGLHSYFYEALFNKPSDDHDGKITTHTRTRTIFDQIRQDVKGILKKCPGYKLYTTGHSSYGAGLSTIASFFLSLDRDIPKPITCINFASPRVGTRSFLKACQFLESTCQLRMVRVANADDYDNDNDNDDPIATIPLPEDYAHAGLQITLYNNTKSSTSNVVGGAAPAPAAARVRVRAPDFHYPILTSDNNSMMTSSLNSNDSDCLEYRERLDMPVAKEFLEKYDLARLYQDEDLVGFELIPLGVKFAIPTATTFGA